MNMIKRILLWILLFNMQVVFGAIKQSNLKSVTEEHKEDMDVGYTSFGAPEYVVSKTENGKKIGGEFLLSNQGFYAEIPIYGIRSVPTKRTPEESRACFLKYSREASPEELALLREYDVEHLRIIDFDSIVKGLPEELQQEIFRVKAMLEACQGAIVQGGQLWLGIEEAMLKGASCDEIFLKGIQEIAGKCAESLASGKVDEATKAGTYLEEEYESIRSSLTEELKSALWGENTVWEAFMREKITPLRLSWLEASLGDLRAVKQWYDYILRWFKEISICPTRRVAVYAQEGIVSGKSSVKQADLRFEGNFLCEMNSETIEAFKKEFRKDFFRLLFESIKATPYSLVECKPEFLVLSLVLLRGQEFSTDYGYYASNLTERLRLALDDMYNKEQQGYDSSLKHPKEVSEALCGFLSFALYDRLGIMWDYSLVGNLDSPLEDRLFKLLKAPLGMAPVQLSGDTLRLWFGLCEESSETIEMEPQKFYNLIQIVALHGSPENIWTGVGFASIDGCVYVNRMIMGQSSYVLPYYRHKFSCHTLLPIDIFCTGPKISEKIRSFFWEATPTVVNEILEEVKKCINAPKPWHGPMQVGRCDEKTLCMIGRSWIDWLQLVSGRKDLTLDCQRGINQVLPLMNKYLALYK